MNKILCDKNVILEIMVISYNIVVSAALMINAKSKAITNMYERNLEVVQMKILCWMC